MDRRFSMGTMAQGAHGPVGSSLLRHGASVAVLLLWGQGSSEHPSVLVTPPSPTCVRCSTGELSRGSSGLAGAGLPPLPRSARTAGAAGLILLAEGVTPAKGLQTS